MKDSYGNFEITGATDNIRDFELIPTTKTTSTVRFVNKRRLVRAPD